MVIARSEATKQPRGARSSEVFRKVFLQERNRVRDAALRQIVVKIVPPVLVHDALGFRDALLHLRELRTGADRVRAGLDDEHRALDLRHLVEEIGVGPGPDELLEKLEIVFADLAE